MAGEYITCETQWIDLDSLLRMLAETQAGDAHIDCDNQYEDWEDIFMQLIEEDVDGYPAIRIRGTDQVAGGTLEIVADGNTGIGQNGNWRFNVDDTPGHEGLYIQKHKTGVWDTVENWSF